MKLLKLLNKILANITIFFIRIYQILLSPDKWIPSFWLKWKVCLHTPHCSKYWIQVLERYWFIPWIFLSMERVMACNPWNDKTYDPSFYKVVFFSSAPIWVPFLEQLASDNRFEIAWVVTSPDKPVWRGLQVQENIIKSTAKRLWIEDIVTPEKISSKSPEGKAFYNWLEAKKPDFLVVIAYWKIIPKTVLELPHFGPINVHWSILPKYRWASPIQSVLLDWEQETGITIMLMSEKMDEWDMIKILKFDLPLSWTAKEIISKMQEVWPKFLVDTLWDFGKWLVSNVPQNHEQATYCSKIEKEDWEVNIHVDTLEHIYNKYRGYYLWPKIFFNLEINWEQKRFIIENIEVDNEIYDHQKHHPLVDKSNKLNIAIKNIWVKPEWKKLISWDEFIKGYIK